MTAYRSRKPFWLTPSGIAAIALIGAAGYFLVVEHRQHLFEWLPWLILALCPVIHIFMHRGHGHGHDHDHNHGDDRDRHDPSRRERDD